MVGYWVIRRLERGKGKCFPLSLDCQWAFFDLCWLKSWHRSKEIRVCVCWLWGNRIQHKLPVPSTIPLLTLMCLQPFLVSLHSTHSTNSSTWTVCWASTASLVAIQKLHVLSNHCNNYITHILATMTLQSVSDWNICCVLPHCTLCFNK